MTTIIEKSATTTTPTSGASLMRAADRAAEDRVNTPVVPRTPASLRKPDHPVVAALKADADAVAAEAATTAARAENLTVQARLTGQRIASLESERKKLADWLANLESIDLDAHKRNAEQTFEKFFGVPNRSEGETNAFGAAVRNISEHELFVKRLPGQIKKVRAKLLAVEQDLAAVIQGSH